MAYERLDLKNGDVLNADHLKHIEDALENGGASADWSVSDENDPRYVKNRTHWKEEFTELEILPETSVQFTNGSATLTGIKGDELKKGAWFDITYNGKAYNGYGLKEQSDDGVYYLGNYNIKLYPFNRYDPPFCIVLTDTDELTLYKWDGDPDNATIKIQRRGGVRYFPLDLIYLPSRLYYEGKHIKESDLPDYNSMFYKKNEDVIDGRYVKDMYYTKEGESILANNVSVTLTLNDAFQAYMGSISSVGLVVGKTYTVVWNGKPYECVASSGVFMDMPFVAIGNGTAFGFPGNNEPFIIGNFDGSSTAMVLGMEPATVKVSIIALADVKNISGKYLGIDWLPQLKKKTAVIENVECTGTSGYLELNATDKTLLDIRLSYMMTIGKKIQICVGDETYEGVVKSETFQGYSILYAGNLGLLDTGYPNTGEDFGVYAVPEIGVADVHVPSVEEAITTLFSMYVLEDEPNKMPEELMPESVDGVVIRSSTEDSTKRFKLTVDDSGTISATEV